MIHPDPHPDAGDRFVLNLLAPDPTRVLYDQLVVEVVDWQDRVTGVSWGSGARHPLHRAYRQRVGQDLSTDPDVVMVKVDEATGTRLVHPTELARRLPG